MKISFNYIKNGLEYRFDTFRLKQGKRIIECHYPSVYSVDSTIEHLINTRSSVVRFGDGEFKIMLGGDNRFQKKSNILAARLKRIIKCNGADEKLMICIPDFSGMKDLFTTKAYSYWESYYYHNAASIVKLLNKKCPYFNAHCTRLYMDWKDKSECGARFEAIRRTWEGRDIVIIEGEKTRFGIGNDLLYNSKTIHRILCPSQNAFDVYDKILKAAETISQDSLILIALGQTATVLAYDLYKIGFQVIDIGHLDIEYEWYNMKAVEKTAIKDKYVAEVDNNSVVCLMDDTAYTESIIMKVGI